MNHIGCNQVMHEILSCVNESVSNPFKCSFMHVFIFSLLIASPSPNFVNLKLESSKQSMENVLLESKSKTNCGK